MANELREMGLGRQAIRQMLEEARRADRDLRHEKWHERAFMYSFHVDDEVGEIAENAYLKFAKTDTLGPSEYPSVATLQGELVAIALELLNGDDNATGSVTTGGTESIFLGLKTGRDWARDRRPEIQVPEIIASRTAHPAFDKAAEYLGMKVIRIPEGPDRRADLAATRQAINDNTVMLVGSAPQYWHGVFDPIGELGELAEAHGLWLHVDACMGGFLAPFVRKLGYPIPDFDFAAPGVRSISADMHKYGFTPKGTSVVLLRDAGDEKYKRFDWSSIYIDYSTPTFSGTRPGGAIAAAWAVMQYLGEKGYLEIAGKIMRAQEILVEGIKEIDELELWSEPELSIISFGSRTLNIFAVAAGLEERGWLPNTFRGPDCIHLRLTPAHEPVAPHFLADLAAAVNDAKGGKHAGAGVTRSYST